MDVVTLSRIQFAVTVGYHFLFVPLSIGLGLVLVLAERRFYKSGSAEDRAASDFWARIFAATFAVGVATGITMEFAFGTNWAAYSRFVGDIFGAPLAAEGLFAFFLESTFLAVLLFGRERVSKRFFYTSTWLVWGGSLLSALWIIIANSWMQTPAGYKVEGGKAVLTDFFAAGFNPSTLPRYAHTIDAILMMGGFLAVGVAAYYMRRGEFLGFARKTMATGIAIAGISTILMLPAGHWQALEVLANQPAKIAAFEGHYQDGPMPLGLVGWVDESAGKTVGLAIPGGVNLLAGDFSRARSYRGLDGFAAADRPPVQASYQTYHLMIVLWGVMLAAVALLWWMNRSGRLERSRGTLTALMWLPAVPMLAIQLGWAAAEIGRQPWIVYPPAGDPRPAMGLRTLDAISTAVPASEVLTTLVLFVIVYSVLYLAWARVVVRMIKAGPVASSAPLPADEPVPGPSGVAPTALATSSYEGSELR